MAHEAHWTANNFSDKITIPPPRPDDHPINSIQNGILLNRIMHALFDSYEVAINPNVWLLDLNDFNANTRIGQS